MRQLLTLKRLFAATALTIIYGVALIISKLVKHKKKKKHCRIIVTGTFHNPNWFFAHIAPLTQSQIGEVILVCDEPIAQLPNLTYICPPNWANTLFSRAGAKAIWTFYAGIKYPADLFMGYHIFPAAITSLLCGKLLGAKTAYQLTAGQLELEGGGWNAENKLLTALQKPSNWIEALALKVTQCFDLLIVRGNRAKAFLTESGCKNNIEIITGSVEISANLIDIEKPIDIMLVGRLAEYKRPDRFLKVVQLVQKHHSDIVVKIVGEGPDRLELETLAKEYGIDQYVEFMGQRKDVPALLGKTKVFVLTSRWEGVSIAMLEAMGLGAVPVVSNVGDLADYVSNGITGFIIPEDDLETFSEKICVLLKSEQARSIQSKSAQNLIMENCERSHVAQRWGKILKELSLAS